MRSRAKNRAVRLYWDQPSGRFPALARDIAEWAEAPGDGNLPDPSAKAFGDWLEDHWDNFTGGKDLTTGEGLRLALEHWIGGRAI